MCHNCVRQAAHDPDPANSEAVFIFKDGCLNAEQTHSFRNRYVIESTAFTKQYRRAVRCAGRIERNIRCQEQRYLVLQDAVQQAQPGVVKQYQEWRQQYCAERVFDLHEAREAQREVIA